MTDATAPAGDSPSPPARTGILAVLLGAVLFAWRSTLRMEFLARDRYESVKARKVPILFALWHGRMFLSIQAHRNEGIATMASLSKDGAIIASWLERNGYFVARGSSSRSGGSALRTMVRQIRGGRHAALTVDGPRGPARVVAPGIVQLARLTGGWILPISSSAARPRFLKSWDRYLVPMPFSRAVVSYGEAFPIPPEMSDEDAAAKIAAAIDATTHEADERLGVTAP